MKRAAAAIAAVLAAALLVAWAYTSQKNSAPAPQPAQPFTAEPAHVEGGVGQALPQTRMRSLFYEKDVYTRAIFHPKEYEGDGRLTAAMLPHHLLAADMMTGVYSLAAKNGDSYDTVIIISPSHFPENCKSDIVTATAGWETPYGTVETDAVITEKLLKNKFLSAENNAGAVEKDHGISVHIPFVRHYLPKARVAVCMVSNKLPQERLAELWHVLAELCKNERILLLASADCSHYLLPENAAEHDVETEQAIEGFDTAKLLRFTDSNVDSPQTVTSFLAVTQARGHTLKQLGHGNSTNYLPHSITNPIYDNGITTYFTYGAFS